MNRATHTQILAAIALVADGQKPSPGATAAATQLGLLAGGALTNLGRQAVEDGVLKGRPDVIRDLLARAFAEQPVSRVLLEGQWGQELSREQATKVLRYAYPPARSWKAADFTRVLDSLNYAGLLSYSRKTGRVRVHAAAPSTAPPVVAASVAPTTPYRNKRVLAEVVASANRHLYWFDPHFPRQALGFIYEEASLGGLQSIRVLSCGRSEVTSAALDDYRRIREELRSRGTSLEWRTLADREDFTDKHDRWLLADDQLWNVPPFSAILAGKWGTILRDTSSPPLDDWWHLGVDLFDLE